MRIRPVLFALLAAIGSSSPTSAATMVDPGVGTLQAAIDAAAPGDALLLGAGTYVGPVVIDKPLRITCVGECYIDANCEAPIALDIASDRVLVRSAAPDGVLQIHRGTHTQIRIANHSKVDLRSRVSAVKLFLNSCGTEQVGIEVSGTSSKVKLLGVRAFNHLGAGLLLSGLAPRPGVKVGSFVGTENAAGIAVENSAVGSKRGASGILIDDALLVDNDIGIRVAGSDGLRVKRTLIVANADHPGLVGITLDAGSNRNVVAKSDWNDRSGTGTSIVDAGTANCGLSNVGFTLASCN